MNSAGHPEILSPLAQKVEDALRDEVARLPYTRSLAPLHNEIERSRARLKQPLRVAVVGLIKAGKSTLMNGLLGQALVPTGAVEATFNVNVFRYGEKPEIRIHYKDGRPPETRPFADLEMATRRSEERMEELLEIAYIEVFHRSEALKLLDLVDTPGLASTYQDDSENTRRFLQIHGDSITATTMAEAASADASLYLFNQSVSETDIRTVEAFLGDMATRLTPMNALGVLTKVDMYWKLPVEGGHEIEEEEKEIDPIQKGRAITERLMRDHPRLRNAFYEMRPVCGLLGEGASSLTEEEFDTLKRLVALDDGQEGSPVRQLFRSDQRFVRDLPGVTVPTEERALLLKRLGLYGVWLAFNALSEGEKSLDEMKASLFAQSGTARIRERVVQHFGNRAALVKIASILTNLRARSRALPKDLSRQERDAVERFVGTLERLEVTEHAFQELRALRDYFDGLLQFSPEESRRLLAHTGENGMEVWEKLEASPDTPPDELERRAREACDFWAECASEPLFRTPSARRAADILRRSCERIRAEITATRKANLS